MEHKVTVLGARCIIEKDKQDDKTVSGIVLPIKAQEEVFTGTVIAIGSGHYTESGTLIPMTVKPGDHVVFAKYAGVPLKVKITDKDSSYLVLNERDVIAIIEEV